MVLLEEFKDKVRPDIRFHLDDQKVGELEKTVVVPDDDALTHKMSSKSDNSQQKRYYGSSNRENISQNTDDIKIQDKSTENVGVVSKVEPLKPISCGHCGKQIENKLGVKAPCEHCGKFNHKNEDCRNAKNMLQKEVKRLDLTSLKDTFLENTEGKFDERNKKKAEKALMRSETRNVKRKHSRETGR